ncbi:hypothetical protein THAOC_01377 [Thalassiosira oceanica]|uniref:Uncharacterized protein n=1 Tax=Thalassiosira oceanica TaxID=159749 RepID=K0TII0_THAOC|nr:hypothetical protein THAOC_01377 [Thalassiosira oceanica]|eukprot:EJK76839.1 hypothetical protein THAOC_01377 [Thalassiosira oceanica]
MGFESTHRKILELESSERLIVDSHMHKLLIPPEFPGIPLHSFLWDLKGTESGFSFPGTQKEREGRFRRLSNHMKL